MYQIWQFLSIIYEYPLLCDRYTGVEINFHYFTTTVYYYMASLNLALAAWVVRSIYFSIWLDFVCHKGKSENYWKVGYIMEGNKELLK